MAQEPVVIQMDVTPEMAYEWLTEHNSDNRRFRVSNMRRLVGIINRGEWHLTPDVVAFDEAGVLLNGQHRLQAIFETGQTLPLMVGKNFKRESFIAIDVGAHRSNADVLDIPQKHAEVAAAFARLDQGDWASITPEVVRKYYEAYKKYIEMLEGAFSSPRRGINPAPARAAVVLRLAKHTNDHQYILSLYESVCKMQLTDAPIVASTYVKHVMDTDKGGRFSFRKNDAGLLLRAWVAFDPSKSAVGRITIKDPARTMAEIRKELRKHMQ